MDNISELQAGGCYRWEKSHGGIVRYYQTWLTQDLWQNWYVTRVWGRKGSELGQVRHSSVKDLGEALKMEGRISRTRKQRGYSLIQLPPRADLEALQ